MTPKPFTTIFLIATFLSYSQWKAVASPNSIKSLDELPYDSNIHLASHILVYTPACTKIIASSGVEDGIYSHNFYLLDRDASVHVFGHLISSGCAAACLEKGTPRYSVAQPMPHRYWINGKVDDLDGDGNEIVETLDFNEFMSSEGCGRVEYGTVNFLDDPVHLYWIDTDTNKKVFDFTLDPGDDRFISTFIGHQFEVYADLPYENKLDNEMISQFIIENNGVISFGNNTHGHFPKEDVASKVKETMNEEWIRQARVTRTFSALGFDKGRLPNDLYASLASYYYNNRHPPHLVLEDWGAEEGIFVNYWETSVEFVHIPPGLAARWQSRLKDLVEEWVGIELETTDMYGMRVYTTGARLVTHVDRVSTHAASLIVNIAQEDVTKPWTIEVNDHANRLHEVVMEPGDIVYYESAKALHGRNTPLQGGKYVNLFTHYRPINDPNWFRRKNPDGTPEPLIDVGECRLVGKSDEFSQGAVQCDNDEIGIHLSPTLFQARSGEDLFRWWKMTSFTVDSQDTQDGTVHEEL